MDKELEKQLIEKSIQGDHEAFRQLIEPVYPVLINAAKRIMNCDADAEDAVQRTIVRAHKALPTFKAISSFKSWTYTIVVNICKNMIRDRRWNEYVSIDLWADYLPDDHDPLEPYNKELIYCILQNEISKLTPKQREVICLFLYQDMRLIDISKKLNVPYNTAKAHFRYGFLRIREAMQERKLTLDDFL